jgi:hypothetical protein
MGRVPRRRAGANGGEASCVAPERASCRRGLFRRAGLSRAASWLAPAS